MSRAKAPMVIAAVLSAAAVVVGIVLLLPDAPTAPMPSASGAAAPTASAQPSAAAPASTSIGRSDAGIGAQAQQPSDEPVALSMPELGVDLAVVPVGVRDDGQMDVPLLVSEAGWYRFGPEPGADAGSAVIAAHVASDQGAAPMAVLLDATPGFTIEVMTRSGEVLRYRVDTVEQLGKERLPVDELFARDGEHRLRLITCAGEWDPVAGAFEDNVVATATLIG
ncbi:Sortase family protein [Agrococcus baldri]|uniref:Sortase family protein n=1 Tax=Agrococcus baldri TaxID=153730 RepID=A0AA94HK88_9MICO|nr:class F sortase [Agrococcus baldri]SFR99341.1 Sortase family protein [Agrococcus baldri]